jgi:hypothetical protein
VVATYSETIKRSPRQELSKKSEFLATDPKIRVRFPALTDFLRSSGLERGPLSLACTIEELLGRKISGYGLEFENTAVGIRRADHAVPSIRKSWY